MQHQILINVIIFVAYVLNLPLNTQRSHSRSQRPGKRSLILAHDRRPIYRAPTYIAVPLLGPHQPRYIGLTLYTVTLPMAHALLRSITSWFYIYPSGLLYQHWGNHMCWSSKPEEYFASAIKSQQPWHVQNFVVGTGISRKRKLEPI